MFARAVAFAAVVVSCTSAFAEYAGPTSYADLPDLRPGAPATKAVVVKGLAGDPSTLQLALLNPDPSPKGTLEKYEVTPDAATKSWKVEAVMKSKTRKAVGKFAIEADGLTFHWEATVARNDAGPLRNCVLTIGDQAIALRNPTKIESLPLDFNKDFSRTALPEDLPDDSLVKMTVIGVQGVEVAGTVSAPETGFKQPVYITLKAEDPTTPAVRLRVELWRATLKPELIIRSEIVLPAAPQTQVPTGNAVQTIAVKPTIDDPTKPSDKTPSLTTRTLIAAKTNLAKQLTAANNQVRIDDNLLVARQNALMDFCLGTDDAVEQMQIGQLQTQIGALKAEIQTLQSTTIPSLEKQVAAFPPLEKLRTDLNQKGTVALRVYYLVGGKPVEALVIGAPAGAAPATKAP